MKNESPDPDVKFCQKLWKVAAGYLSWSVIGFSPRTSLLERRDSVFPIPRDSPENPFLASALGADDEVFTASTVSGSQVEKPTIAFVFRGVRLSFLNPYYNAPSSTDSSPNSQLPPEHSELGTTERPGVRKLLFGRKKGSSRSRRFERCDEDWLAK
ncbi:hypothetical protein B0H13DRAFT_1867627 [Mycena leptocephala]|nr:hypothetical protein B0H13DRAFT_1867627 [Mycena leptocephala]